MISFLTSGHSQVSQKEDRPKISIEFLGETSKKEDTSISLAPGEVLIKSKNPNYKGILKTHLEDFSLNFRLLNSNNILLWEKRARSEWILMADEVDIIVMIGKREEEGFRSVHNAIFENFSIYDSGGDLVNEANNTGSIIQANLTLSGNLIILSEGRLICFNDRGEILWQVPTAAHKFHVLQQGKYVSTEAYNNKDDIRTAEVFDQYGKLIKEIRDTNFSHVGVIAASADGNFIISRRLIQSNPLIWQISLFDTRRMDSPSKEYELSGAPIEIMIANEAQFFAVVLNKRSNNEDEMERILEILDRHGEQLYEYSLGNFSMAAPPVTNLSFSSFENQLIVMNGETDYLFLVNAR